MEIKIKQLTEKAIAPENWTIDEKGIKGVDLAVSRITTELAQDAQLILVVHTDFSIDIPDGYIGLAIPVEGIAARSIIQCNGIQIINPGDDKEVALRFKVLTNVVPAILKEGERFARLILVPHTNIETVILPYEKPIEEVKESEEAISTETAMTNEVAAQIEE